MNSVAQLKPCPDGTDALHGEAIGFVQAAKVFLIQDQLSHDQATAYLKDIKAKSKDVIAWFEEPKTAAKKAYDSIRSREKEILTPLEEAESILKTKLGEFYAAQKREKMRLEAEARKHARKLEEEEHLQRAEEAEEAGDTEAVDSILNEPPKPLTLPIPQNTFARAQGVAAKSLWKYRIVNAAQLPREFMTPDEKKIGGIVRAMKGQTRIPGVEVYEEKSIAVTV